MSDLLDHPAGYRQGKSLTGPRSNPTCAVTFPTKRGALQVANSERYSNLTYYCSSVEGVGVGAAFGSKVSPPTIWPRMSRALKAPLRLRPAPNASILRRPINPRHTVLRDEPIRGIIFAETSARVWISS